MADKRGVRRQPATRSLNPISKLVRDRDAPAGDPLHPWRRAAVFACLDTSAKYLVLSGMSAPFVAWMRFVVHVVLVLVLFRGWSNPAMFRASSLPQQILRGLFLFGSTIFNFLALKTLQLAETTSIFFFAPMVITALAGPLLGEWAGWRRWLAIVVGFAGVLVITRPGVGAVRARPRLCALRDAELLLLRHHDAAHGGDRNAGKPDLLFGAGAGRADAAGRALHGLAAAGRLPLADPAVARRLRRLRPLAADPGLPAWRRPRRWRPIPICRWSG